MYFDLYDHVVRFGGVGTTKVSASRETETKNCDFVERLRQEQLILKEEMPVSQFDETVYSLSVEKYFVYISSFAQKMHLVENLSNIHSIQTTRNQ